MKTITYNPETHVLVPREPTKEMNKAAAFNYSSDEYTGFTSTYKAMLAASPQPEPNESEPVYQVCMADSVSLSGAWIDVDKQTYHDAGLYKEYKLRLLYTTPQPDRTAELEQLRQRVQELEKQRDDFRRDAAEFSSQVSRLVDHNNNLVNHREELILEITRIKRGDFSNERIENDSLKLCINVQNGQIEKLTAERDALMQQRDELLAALEKIKLRSISLADAQVVALEAIATVNEK